MSGRLSDIAGKVMVEMLKEEERTGEPVIRATIQEIADSIGEGRDDTSNAMRLTRTPGWIEANGWSIPSLGNGRPGSIHGYVLEYGRAGVELSEEQLREHARRLVVTLRSLTAQFQLAEGLADGRTTVGRAISMSLKAVDLAADSLEIGVGAE